MNHSTSFWAAGSPIDFSTAVASLVLALRARSIACLTAARSPVSGAAVACGGDSSCAGAGLVRAAAAACGRLSFRAAVLCGRGVRAVASAFFAYPLITFGVIARIHWQALRLWVKRVPWFSKPAAPLEDITR